MFDHPFLFLSAPLWKLTQQVSHLGVFDLGSSWSNFGCPENLDDRILDPQVALLSEALVKAERLETVRWCGTYDDEVQDPSTFNKFIRTILPKLACVSVLYPSTYIPYQYMNGLLALHPQVEALSIRKHTLEAADIQELGREAGEERIRSIH